MEYYKDNQNKVYAYESQADRDKYGKPDLVEITEQEAMALANPPPSTEQLAIQARAKRDTLLAASDFSQLPDAPVDSQAWSVYRQALRDVPDQAGFPENITWPESP